MIKKVFKVICIIWLFYNLLSCEQKKEISLMDQETFVLTEETFVPVLHKEVQKYPDEPLYFLLVSPHHCNYKILVNDLPVYNSLKDEMDSIIYINNAILQTGLQKITYFLYPKDGEETLGDFSELQIRICKKQAKKGLNNYEEFISFPSPKRKTLSGENISDGSGEKIYENNILFHAEVPYKNKGWSNGQNLLTIDTLVLKKAVINFYKNTWDMLRLKKKNELFTFLYKKEKERVVSSYNNKNEIKKLLDLYLNLFNSSFSYNPQNLNKLDISFYGNGKLVRLENNSNFQLTTKSENEPEHNYDHSDDLISFYLYLPNGKSLHDGLEIIR